jgi:asparagine synthase (glutamine-hydrolysing)
MCGILGIIDLENKNQLLNLDFISKLLHHRGPNAFNHSKFEHVSLFHYRLAIQALQDGKQPMCYKDNQLCYNGELYNHLDCRKKFNLACNTKSDTETLIQLLTNKGMHGLNEVDGMFAFAFLDTRYRKLFLVRDRAGKKPLYLYKKQKKIIFSSELNALQQLSKDSINMAHINLFLQRGFFMMEETPYENTIECPAGSYIEIDIDTLDYSISQWWTIQTYYKEKSSLSFNDSLNLVETTLRNSIKRRLETSDLDVGIFLSGGIDSGIITAIASEFSGNPLKTITMKFEKEYDESTLAKLVSNKYQTHHIECDINFNNIPDLVEKIIPLYGEPYIDASAIPSYLVAQEAKKHLTVCLNGDGADELFFGYRRYVPCQYMDLLKENSKAYSTVMSMLNSLLPNSSNRLSKYNYFKRLIKILSKTTITERYISLTTDFFDNKILKNLQEDNKLNQYLLSLSDFNGLSKVIISDFECLLFSNLLPKMDIATMAHSLEVRSPFLSKDLLETIPQMSHTHKLAGTSTKLILRELAKKYLPSELATQPKRGFEIPLKNWIFGPLKELTHDLLTTTSFSSEFIEKSYISNLITNKHVVSQEQAAKQIWMLICLELFYKKYKSL